MSLCTFRVDFDTDFFSLIVAHGLGDSQPAILHVQDRRGSS